MEELTEGINKKIMEYLAIKQEAEMLKQHAENLKKEIDIEMNEDHYELEGAFVFNRRKPYIRKTLDKTQVAKYLTEDVFNLCFKTTNVAGPIEIMTWEAFQNRKQMLKNKK